MTEEYEHEKAGHVQYAFGPLNNSGVEPVAGQERELGEARFYKQLVEHIEYSSFEHIVCGRLRPPPESRQHHGQGHPRYGHDLKTAAVKETRELNGQPGTSHSGQADKESDHEWRGQIKMPGHPASKTKRNQ